MTVGGHHLNYHRLLPAPGDTVPSTSAFTGAVGTLCGDSVDLSQDGRLHRPILGFQQGVPQATLTSGD